MGVLTCMEMLLAVHMMVHFWQPNHRVFLLKAGGIFREHNINILYFFNHFIFCF